MPGLLIGLGLVVAVSLAPVGKARAQSKSVRWLRWDADITINTDGTFRVVETQQVQFIGGPFTFGFRNIPMGQVESITDIRVVEDGVEYLQSANEAPNTFYTQFEGGELVVNWFYPSTIDQVRTWTIEYTVVGGLIIFDDGDQLFYTITVENLGPADATNVTVLDQLPDEVQFIVDDLDICTEVVPSGVPSMSNVGAPSDVPVSTQGEPG